MSSNIKVTLCSEIRLPRTILRTHLVLRMWRFLSVSWNAIYLFYYWYWLFAFVDLIYKCWNMYVQRITKNIQQRINELKKNISTGIIIKICFWDTRDFYRKIGRESVIFYLFKLMLVLFYFYRFYLDSKSLWILFFICVVTI